MKTVGRVYLRAGLAFIAAALVCSTENEGATRDHSNQARHFASPEEAIQALTQATASNDKAAVREIFGPSISQMLTGDEAQDAANFASFSKAIKENCTPIKTDADKVVLELGPDQWPFPIPLVKQAGSWFFDTDAGKEEIICRHIGRDELHAIGLCRKYVEAQRQFAHDQRLPAPVLNRLEVGDRTNSLTNAAFHGYRFKILTRQGRSAPAGKMDYVVDGKMTRGFALVAYPIYWGRSGVMTFIISQDGRLYQRNLGKRTAEIASAIKEYNPTSDWKLVEEPGVTD